MPTAHLPVDYRDLGRMLKDTREATGAAIDEISAALHIRPKFLSALEKGDLALLPGDVYVRGYLKRYADHLGYDGAAMLGAITSSEPKAPPARYLPPDRSGRRSRSWIIVPIGLALGVFALHQPAEKDAAAPPVEPLPERFLPLLDLGTPRLPETMPPPSLCQDVQGGLAEAFCGQQEIVLSFLFAEPPRRTIINQAETLPWQLRAVWPREAAAAADPASTDSVAEKPAPLPALRIIVSSGEVPAEVSTTLDAGLASDSARPPAGNEPASSAAPPPSVSSVIAQTPVASPYQPRYNEPLWKNPFREEGHR